MKRLEEIIESVDARVDRSFGRAFAVIIRHFTMFSSVFLALLLGVFLFKIVYHRVYYLSSVMEQDIVRVANILTRIDKDCSILSIKGERTVINFLNVKSFVGSNIGGLNLAYPKNWQGPYVNVNPTHQHQFYELVQTSEGLFIVPGFGVKLPNGLVMGRDVVVGYDVSIKKMLAPGGVLNSDKGAVLGMQLNFRIGQWDPVVKGNKSSLDKVNFLLSEFNQAIPFAHSDGKNVDS